MAKNSPFPKPSLTTKKLCPENQESPIHFQRNWVTYEPQFYIRNHFPYPNLDINSFFLTVDGKVSSPKIFSYEELTSLPSKILLVPLECAGNRRSFFEPKVFGEQWEEGALSQGLWKGVSLKYLLDIAEVSPEAVEIVFEGRDYGTRTDMPAVFPYARSLPLPVAFHPDVIIAYELNGSPLPFKHGYPFRLIVPQWYGMASVKWLKAIKVTSEPFQGPFQTIDYMYYPDKETDIGKFPASTLNVNSLIQYPLNRSVLPLGRHLIMGLAYSGAGSIVKVEISFDRGKTWVSTKHFQHPFHQYAWSFWQYSWDVKEKGEFEIRIKATDSCGRTQPEKAFWNRKGYGYNEISKVLVKIG